MHCLGFCKHVLLVLAGCHQVKVGGQRSCVPDVDVESSQSHAVKNGLLMIYFLGGREKPSLTHSHTIMHNP